MGLLQDIINVHVIVFVKVFSNCSVPRTRVYNLLLTKYAAGTFSEGFCVVIVIVEMFKDKIRVGNTKN